MKGRKGQSEQESAHFPLQCWGQVRDAPLPFDANMKVQKVLKGLIPEPFRVDLARSPRTPGEPASQRGQTPAALPRPRRADSRRSGDREMDGNRTLLLPDK